MKYVSKIITGVGFALSLQTVYAVGTAAGTDIDNVASANYQVAGIDQAQEDSNTATFKVDRKVIFTLVRDNTDHVAATPGAGIVVGSSPVVLSYTLVNQSNDTLDFDLAAINDSDPVDAGANFVGTDNVNPTSFIVRGDTDNSGAYTAVGDTKSFLDQIPADATRKVFVVASFNTSFDNGDIAGIKLTAIASDGSAAGASVGAALVNANGAADLPGTVQNVFAELTGDGGDANYDGQISVLNSYEIAAANITVSKTSTLIGDPINCTDANDNGTCTNPKRIPGAIIEYEITVSNAAGAATATSVVVDDVLAATMAYNTGTLQADDGGGYDPEDDNSAGVGDLGNFDGSDTIYGTFGSMAASTTRKLKFRVTLQ